MSRPNHILNTNVVIPESKILDCFMKHLKKNKEILQKLDQILINFQRYDRKRFGAKFAGTAASVMGTAGLALAPLSAGSSLILTWIGGVAMGSGFVINGTTELVNYYESKEAIDAVIRLAATRDNYINKEQEVIENLMQYAVVIKVRENLNNDQAIGKAMYEHMNGCITFSETDESLIIDQPTDVLSVIPNPSQQTRHGIAGSVLISGGESTGAVATQLVSRGVILTTAKTAGQIIKYAGIGLSGIFVTIDVYLLAKDWMSTHPTIEKILEIKNKLTEEIWKLEKNIEIIRRYGAEGRALRVDNLEEVVRQQRVDLEVANQRIQELQSIHRQDRQEIEEVVRRMDTLEANRQSALSNQ